MSSFKKSFPVTLENIIYYSRLKFLKIQFCRARAGISARKKETTSTYSTYCTDGQKKLNDHINTCILLYSLQSFFFAIANGIHHHKRWPLTTKIDFWQMRLCRCVVLLMADSTMLESSKSDNQSLKKLSFCDIVP